MTPCPDPLWLQRLTSSTCIAQVEWHEELASTNDRALELARRMLQGQPVRVQLPLVIWAQRQTRGRGRGSHRWWSAAGGLTFSVLFDPKALGIPVQRWPSLSPLGAVAVLQALRDWYPEGRWALKWPNDVYLNHRKLAGVLVESISAAETLVVLGIGVNVNNPLDAAPPEVAPLATSLRQWTGREFDLAEVLLGILQAQDRLWRLLSIGELSLPGEWEPWCMLRGHQVLIASPQGKVQGRCFGLDEDGALLVQNDQGLHRVLSGTVVEYR